jgi:3',5'-cyclic AMP phosphodiesterase CpdA
MSSFGFASAVDRRTFTRGLALAGAGLVSGLWPGRALAQDAAAGEQGNFTFISVNDLHFTDAKLCPPWFEKTFNGMRESAPQAEFVLVSGDLTSECTRVEFAGIRECFEMLKLPVYVTCGNHDMTLLADHKLYDEYFPGRYHYAFEHRGWQFFGFNTANGRGADNISMKASVFKWQDENLKKYDPRKPSVIFTHFPQGFGLKRRSVNSDQFLAGFKDFNVQAILNGHWHGYSETAWRDAWITTDRCCSRYRDNHDGSPLKGWFVCEARDGRVTRRFVPVPA